MGPWGSRKWRKVWVWKVPKAVPAGRGHPGLAAPAPLQGPPSPAAAVTVRAWVFLELLWTAVTISAHGVHGIGGSGGEMGTNFPFYSALGWKCPLSPKERTWSWQWLPMGRRGPIQGPALAWYSHLSSVPILRLCSQGPHRDSLEPWMSPRNCSRSVGWPLWWKCRRDEVPPGHPSLSQEQLCPQLGAGDLPAPGM